MPGAFLWGIGNCDCCECPQTLCVNVRCTGTSTPICGATVELWNEAADTLLDSCTTCDIATDYVADFEADNSEYLNAADESDMRAAEGFWIAGWIKPETLGSGIRGIACKQGGIGSNISWALTHDGSTLRWSVSLNGTSYITVTRTSALAADTWAFVWGMIQTDKAQIAVNNGTIGTSATFLSSVNPGTAGVEFGRYGTTYYDGLMRSFGCGLTATSASTVRSTLYNSGTPLKYADLSGATKTSLGLTHWWDLDEVGGDRDDSHAAVTLTDNNTVGSVALTTVEDGSGGCCFSGVVGSTPVTYTVKVHKTGYVTVDDDATWEDQVTFDTCSQTLSLTAELCPESVDVDFSVFLIATPSCPVNGASVELAGDSTASGTTSAAGVATLTIDKPAGKCTATITATGTAPASYNAAPKTSESFTVNLCTGATTPSLVTRENGCAADTFAPPTTIIVPPDTGFVAVVCDCMYMPDSLSYSDDYGTATLTFACSPPSAAYYWSGAAWYGSYTEPVSFALIDNGFGGCCVGTGDATIRIAHTLGYTQISGAGKCADRCGTAGQRFGIAADGFSCTGGVPGNATAGNSGSYDCSYSSSGTTGLLFTGQAFPCNSVTGSTFNWTVTGAV